MPGNGVKMKKNGGLSGFCTISTMRCTRPDQHPEIGAEILKEKGYPPDVIYAIRSHADYLGLDERA